MDVRDNKAKGRHDCCQLQPLNRSLDYFSMSSVLLPDLTGKLRGSENRTDNCTRLVEIKIWHPPLYKLSSKLNICRFPLGTMVGATICIVDISLQINVTRVNESKVQETTSKYFYSTDCNPKIHTMTPVSLM